MATMGMDTSHLDLTDAVGKRVFTPRHSNDWDLSLTQSPAR